MFFPLRNRLSFLLQMLTVRFERSVSVKTCERLRSVLRRGAITTFSSPNSTEFSLEEDGATKICLPVFTSCVSELQSFHGSVKPVFSSVLYHKLINPDILFPF